jgi:hypothetical protein
VITRRLLLADHLGAMVAYLDVEGPSIEFVITPDDEGTRMTFEVSPSEARQMAAEIGGRSPPQHSTPDVLAEVRENYLSGMTDEQIIERLDRLSLRLGGLVLGHRRKIDWRAGRILRAERAIRVPQEGERGRRQRGPAVHRAEPRPGWLADLRQSIKDQVAFYERETPQET